MGNIKVQKDPASVTITKFGIPLRAKEASLTGVTIMLNPGHGCLKNNGALDTGASAKLGKKIIYEMDLNDQVAVDVRRKLELLGATVIYVDNTKVQDIQNLENQYKPDLFLAIHQDALSLGSGKGSGETVYAWGEKSLVLRKEINDFLAADKTIPNRGYSKYVKDHSSELVVLNADPSIPAVLTEIGYMSNPKELKTLVTPEYQDKAAQCIVEGIKKYIKKIKREKESKEVVPYMFMNKYKPWTSNFLLQNVPTDQ